MKGLYPFIRSKFTFDWFMVGHWILMGLLASFLAFLGMLTKTYAQDIELFMLSSEYQVQQRGPGNFIPNEEIIAAPIPIKTWISDLVIEDEKGVLVGMREQLKTWQRQEEYLKRWNLENSGLIVLATEEEKEKFLRRQALKYVDKRLSGEIKRAEEGSTMAQIGEVKETLSPSSKFSLSENVRLRFRAKVLAGQATVLLQNPWIETEGLVKASGNAHLKLAKRFEDIQLQTHLIYNFRDQAWEAMVNKKINPQLDLRFTALAYDGKMITDADADQRLEFIWGFPF